MKKKTVANLIMVAIILGIVAAGVVFVGHVQGWFDANDGTYATLCDIVGIINLERDGVSFTVSKDTVLRAGDTITCESGATARIDLSGDQVTIGEKATFTVTSPMTESFCVDVQFGQLFANCSRCAIFTFEDHSVPVSDSVALLSVRSGAQTITVFSGTVLDVAAGNFMEIMGEDTAVSPLQITSLNDFALTQIRKANESTTLCVTNAQLDQLAADRLAAIQDAINNAGSISPTDPDETETVPDGFEPTVSTPENGENAHTHQYMDQVVAPTCKEKGYTVHTCGCGDSYQDSYTKKTDHNWGDWVTTVAPTTEKEGVKERTCIYCDAVQTQSIPVLEAGHIHKYSEKVIAPTCTVGGYTLYSCQCGMSYQDKITNATGHIYKNIVIAPTCTEKGYTIHTCSCGDSYMDSYKSATGHNWGSWVVVKEATTSSTGLKKSTCKDCGVVRQEKIDKLTETATAGAVYLTIRCDTILDNLKNLNSAKAEFVPNDGVILPMVSVFYYEGETVFDVLNRVCEIMDIQIEYSWTPLYNSYYIEGINNLYEFDCGEQSGWMYKVNEWFPDYGCSSYTVSDGDVIVWCFTCNGYGEDVGNYWMGE